MFKPKKVLVSLSVATLLSVGAVSVNQVNTTPTVVEASAVAKKKLTHNAYLYRNNGKRYGKKVLKKGRTIKVYGEKTIKGKKYYRVGKKQYVKLANFKAKKTAKVENNTGVAIQYHLTHNAFVYNSKGQRVKSVGTLKKNHLFNVVGTKTIKGQDYLALGNDRYVKASNAQSVASTNTNVSTSNDSNNVSSNTSTSVVTSNTSGTTDSTKQKTPSGNTNTSSNTGSTSGSKGNKNVDYIKFNESEVNQIQSYLWQKINEYRQSKGYPAYKTNSELTNFVNRALEEGTPEYQAVGYGNGTIQNTDTIGQFLPKLKALGMDSARSMTDLDAFGYGSAKQFFLNLKERDPKKVADEIFNAYTKEDDSMNLRTLQGYKDKYAYASLKVKYNGDGTYSQRGLILNFTVVGSYAPDWISAWEKN